MNIEDLIAEANPVPLASVADGDSPRAQRTLALVLEHGEAAARHGAHQRAAHGGRPSRSGAKRRLPQVVAVLTVSGAAAGLVITLLAPGGHEGRKNGPVPRASTGARPGTLAAALDSLSLAAHAQPAEPAPGPGQFEYTDSLALNWIDTYNGSATSYSVSYTERRQIWIGPTGTGRIAETYSNPQLGSAKDRAGWIAAGRPNLAVAPTDSRFGPGQLSNGPPNLNRLPDDPAKLAALLTARKIEGGPKGPAEDFVQIGDLLRETYVRPSLRAAIFTVAERIPGVRLLGTVTDQAGRSGIGLAYVSAHPALHQIVKSVLVFDPKTSKMIAEETIVSNTRTGKTALVAWTDYLKSGVVNSETSTAPVSPAGPAQSTS
ncbi:MAG TPA: CU044_5270 family protein [Streptosporangiaceae bacterium]|nr:CU044_5270 family protein [Streptosporangiaceae bacterium]